MTLKPFFHLLCRQVDQQIRNEEYRIIFVFTDIDLYDEPSFFATTPCSARGRVTH